METWLWACAGFTTGFCFYCITSPKQGENHHRSCILAIPCTDKAIHAHHYMYLLLAFPFVYPMIFPCGFCAWGIVQSFVWYTDSFEIIVPRNRSLCHVYCSPREVEEQEVGEVV